MGRKNRRILLYLVIALFLCVGYLMLHGSAWVGTKELHTTMEAVATLLAILVGWLSLIRYYSKREGAFLLIGVGFIGTAFLDGYHAIVTSVFFDTFFPSPPPSLIPWSWVASRLFLSLLLFASWWVWYQNWKRPDGFKISDKLVYVLISSATLVSFSFFAFVPLPRAYYPELFFHRPEELLPAVFFIAALIGYLKKGQWAYDDFDHWLVISLIVGVISQVVFMPFSGLLFDIEFDVAHLLKKISYICVLTGLNVSIYHLYKHEEQQRLGLEESQRALQKANIEMRSANQLKTEFMANMSHELRTPMNSIIGFTSRVIKKSGEQIPQRQLDNLFIVERNAKQLLALINELLDISKIEAGRMELYIEPLELGRVLEEVVTINRHQVDEKHLSLNVNMPSAPVYLETDHQKLRDLLVNLVANAIKFTDKGSVTLRIDAPEKTSIGTEQISIHVIDTGIGIGEHDIPYIFDAFRQIDGSTTRQAGGTGLGLAICKNFAELLNGEVIVNSIVGEGSTFTVTLPLTMGDFIESKLKHASGSDKTSADDPLVLCIDDDPEVIELLKEVLTDEGYQVAGATTGDEGLSKAKQLNPFAITLDIMMQKKDGWQVLKELKESDETRDIPVIMLTVVENRKWGYKLGAVDYILKPIDNDALLSSLESLSDATTVLVVDDNPDIRSLLTQQLEDDKYHVKTAANGQQALEQIGELLPNLILLDLMMPVMDGFDFLKQLEKDESWRRIPVVVLTAKELTSNEKQLLDQRVKAVIKKDGDNSARLMQTVKQQIKQLVEKRL